MRNVTLLDNVAANTQQVSDALNLERRTDWELIIESNSLDGTPQLFIERGFNAGKCNPEPSEWQVLQSGCNEAGYFPIDDSVIQILKDGFTANWFRVRVEAEDNTTGNITVTIHYKDYP